MNKYTVEDEIIYAAAVLLARYRTIIEMVFLIALLFGLLFLSGRFR